MKGQCPRPMIATAALSPSSFYNLILVLQNTSSHSTLNRVNVKNKFCPRWDSNPQLLNLRQAGKLLTGKPSGIGKRLQEPSGIDSINQCRIKHSIEYRHVDELLNLHNIIKINKKLIPSSDMTTFN